MSYKESETKISRIAGADLSANQFEWVTLDSSGKVILAADGEDGLGVLQNKPLLDQAAEIAVLGVTQAKFGGSVNVNDQIAIDANAKTKTASAAVTNTADGGSTTDPLIGSNVKGKALTSGALNEIGEILVLHEGAVPTTLA